MLGRDWDGIKMVDHSALAAASRGEAAEPTNLYLPKWSLSLPSHPHHSSPHRMLRALLPRAATLTRTHPIALPTRTLTRTFFTSQLTMSSPYTVVATESEQNGFGDETETS
jgi:hypothetical protein